MKTIIYSTMMSFAILGTIACSNDENLPEEPKEETPEYRYQDAKEITLTRTEEAVNEGLKDFSWNLFSQAYKKGNGENVLISPYSLEADLVVLLNGLKGSARQELLSVLGLSKYTQEEINTFFSTMCTGIEEADNMTQFCSNYSLWYNKRFKLNPSFSTLIGKDFGCDVFPVAFGEETTKAINDWCSKKTFGRISKMLDQTNNSELLHLINAVYFRSSWRDLFMAENTKEQSFTQQDGQKASVQMMKNTIWYRATYESTPMYSSTMLPFNNGAFGMFFVLPQEGVSMQETIHSISSQMPRFNHLKPVEALEISLPKFTTQSTCHLKEALSEMGAREIFSNPKDSKIFDNTEACVNEILQKTFLSVNEEGAEAAAVTDINVVGASETEPKIEHLVLNRPFLYGIIETSTGMHLFLGYYGNVEE